MSKSKCKKDEDLEAVFNMFDKDKSGKISAKELHRALNQMGLKLTEKEAKKLLDNDDKDQDGELDKCEFKQLLAAAKEEEQKKAFDAFDTDKSGFITKDELEKVMKKVAPHLTKKDVDEMFDAADTVKDGKVSFEEFKAMMPDD